MPLPLAGLALRFAKSSAAGGGGGTSIGKITTKDFTASYLSDARTALEAHIEKAARLVEIEATMLLNLKSSSGGNSRSKAGEPPYKDTGALGASIEVETARTAMGEFVARIGPADFAQTYGKLLEFGTSSMAPRPFLRPAFDNKEDEILAEIAKGMKAASSGKGQYRDPATGMYTSGGN